MEGRQVLEILARYAPSELSPGAGSRAAVLVPLLRHADDSIDVLFTRRSLTLGSHAGQVSFPGGRVERADANVVDTALRETREELAIAPSLVDVVARLDDTFTITGFHVTPIVGVLPGDVAVTPNPAEVARVFTVPLRRLLDLDGWERRAHAYRGGEISVWHFPYDGEDIWGVTGHMVRGLVEMLAAGA